MQHSFKRARLALALVSAFAASSASAEVREVQHILLRADWPQYINGANLLALPALRAALAGFAEDKTRRIVIRHPGGDAGREWAMQVRDWLIAHGAPPEYLQMQIGAGAPDRIVLRLVGDGVD